MSSTIGLDVTSGAAPVFLSFNSVTQPSIKIGGGSEMLLAASERLEKSESGNEVSVSVEPSLSGRSITNRGLGSEAGGQYRGTCSREVSSSSSSASEVVNAP